MPWLTAILENTKLYFYLMFYVIPFPFTPSPSFNSEIFYPITRKVICVIDHSTHFDSKKLYWSRRLARKEIG